MFIICLLTTLQHPAAACWPDISGLPALLWLCSGSPSRLRRLDPASDSQCLRATRLEGIANTTGSAICRPANPVLSLGCTPCLATGHPLGMRGCRSHRHTCMRRNPA